jgi:L,D-transpeptidase YbiS
VTEFPVWRKPDWAFLEEGEPLPARDGDRMEYGVLGSFALGIGDGYYIHGTLYTRLLGQNVTHGCIRLSEADLDRLVDLAPLGTPVFIF